MKTTINMRLEVYQELCEINKKTGLKLSEVVKLALAQIAKNEPVIETYKGAVAYQEESDEWKIFHISFNQNEYERNIDFRKVFKLSLSFIVALALSLYSEGILAGERETCKDVDSYTSNNYYLYTESDINSRIMVFIWEKHKKKP